MGRTVKEWRQLLTRTKRGVIVLARGGGANGQNLGACHSGHWSDYFFGTAWSLAALRKYGHWQERGKCRIGHLREHLESVSQSVSIWSAGRFAPLSQGM